MLDQARVLALRPRKRSLRTAALPRRIQITASSGIVPRGLRLPCHGDNSRNSGRIVLPAPSITAAKPRQTESHG